MPLGVCAARFKHNHCTTGNYQMSNVLLGLVKARFTPGLGVRGAGWCTECVWIFDLRHLKDFQAQKTLTMRRSCTVDSGCCNAIGLKRVRGPARQFWTRPQARCKPQAASLPRTQPTNRVIKPGLRSASRSASSIASRSHEQRALQLVFALPQNISPQSGHVESSSSPHCLPHDWQVIAAGKFKTVADIGWVLPCAHSGHEETKRAETCSQVRAPLCVIKPRDKSSG